MLYGYCVYNQLQNKNHHCQCKQMHGNYFQITTALCHLTNGRIELYMFLLALSIKFHCSVVVKFANGSACIYASRIMKLQSLATHIRMKLL